MLGMVPRIISVLIQHLEADTYLHAECRIYHHGFDLGHTGLLSWD